MRTTINGMKLLRKAWAMYSRSSAASSNRDQLILPAMREGIEVGAIWSAIIAAMTARGAGPMAPPGPLFTAKSDGDVIGDVISFR